MIEELIWNFVLSTKSFIPLWTSLTLLFISMLVLTQQDPSTPSASPVIRLSLISSLLLSSPLLLNFGTVYLLIFCLYLTFCHLNLVPNYCYVANSLSCSFNFTFVSLGCIPRISITLLLYVSWQFSAKKQKKRPS